MILTISKVSQYFFAEAFVNRLLVHDRVTFSYLPQSSVCNFSLELECVSSLDGTIISHSLISDVMHCHVFSSIANWSKLLFMSLVQAEEHKSSQSLLC